MLCRARCVPTLRAAGRPIDLAGGWGRKLGGSGCSVECSFALLTKSLRGRYAVVWTAVFQQPKRHGCWCKGCSMTRS